MAPKKRKTEDNATESSEALNTESQAVVKTEPQELKVENNEAEDQENDSQNGEDMENDDEESIEKLLEPFGKEQIMELLKEAAESHPEVAARIRCAADVDPSHRKVFVFGLGWDVTTDMLMKTYKPYGEIEECKAVCDKFSGKCKGYGFIQFKSRRGAYQALKEPQKKICGRITTSQLAAVGPVAPGVTGGYMQAQVPVSEYTQRKIYVSNVGAELDPQKLTAFFAKFGEIEEGPLGLDKVTGKPKGFCLFVYKSIESARKALQEPHKNFEGHILHCQKAIDGPKLGKGQMLPQSFASQAPPFQRGDNFHGSGNLGHMMAPSAPAATGLNQGAVASALTPAIGQALTALLANQGAGLGLSNLLGSLGSGNPGMQQPSSGGVGNFGTQGAASSYGGGIGRGHMGLGQHSGTNSYLGR